MYDNHYTSMRTVFNFELFLASTVLAPLNNSEDINILPEKKEWQYPLN